MFWIDEEDYQEYTLPWNVYIIEIADTILT